MTQVIYQFLESALVAMRIRIQGVKPMQIRADPDPGYIFWSEKVLFCFYLACTSPPAPGAGARGTPPPDHLYNKFHGWPSISNPRIPDIFKVRIGIQIQAFLNIRIRIPIQTQVIHQFLLSGICTGCNADPNPGR
jgi:hypothetical protein